MSGVGREAAIQRLKERDREIQLLNHTSAVLGWDQETYMPRRAIDERSAQLALLQGLMHERTVAAENEGLLDVVGCSTEQLSGSPDLPDADGAFLRRYYRRYLRAVKLPQKLVVTLAEKASLAQAVWIDARKANDFPRFAPHLEGLLDLLLEVCDRIGYEDHPYDVLLDQYEPFMKTAAVDHVFTDLRARLVPLVSEIATAEQVDDTVLKREFPVAAQAAFGKAVMAVLGYDFERGRLDESAHPFTTTLGMDDVRITTRYNKDFFNTAIFGTIHEVGHGLYELGFADCYRGTLLAEGTSLGIHESQSRMWENLVGRSRPFWRFFYPILKSHFPDALAGIDRENFYRAINKVEPSLIRVEADEVTYGLHVVLRFELEKAMISRTLRVRDLPEIWRAKSGELLGVEPETDADGVLQDIHWSMGGMGYFPTYALGNLYAAAFMEKIDADLPHLWDQIAEGDFSSLLGWLRGNIHRHGAARSAEQLCVDITGAPLGATPFVAYLRAKYRDIYGLG
jgi:carboxypeptidase Taq